MQAEEVITPVAETAPYVVDAIEQRQPIELSVETPEVENATVKEDVEKTFEDKKDELEKKYGKRFKNEETYHLITGGDGNYYIKHEDRGEHIKTYKFQTEEQAKKFAEKESVELLTSAKQGVGFTSENRSKYDTELAALEEAKVAAPVVKEETPSAENDIEFEKLNESDFEENGDLTDDGFTKAENALKGVIKNIANKYKIPVKNLLSAYNIKNGGYFSSLKGILNVGENRDINEVIKIVKDISFEMFPDKIDELNDQINKYKDELLDSIVNNTPFKANKGLQKVVFALTDIDERWNELKNVTKTEFTPYEEVKPTPKVEAPTKKEEAKPEVKAVELEARFPGGMHRKMEFKDGEWKQNVGGEYTTVAPAVQQQAQEAFDGIKTEVKKEEVNPVEKSAVAEVTKPEVKKDVKEEVKAEVLNDVQNELIKKATEKSGEDFVNRDRVIDRAKKISEKDGKKEITNESIAEAIQYETVLGEDFSGIRKAIEKGGIELNRDVVQRMVDVGLDVPSDITTMLNKKEDLTAINEKLKNPLGKKVTIGGVEYKITDVGTGVGSPDITLVDKDGNTYYQETKTADGRTIKRLPTKSGLLSALKEEAKKEPKETPKSNKQPVAKPAKVEKVAEEKPIESNKKEDIIDKEEEANVEADKSVKEDENLVFEIENVNIAKLKAEKDEKMIEQRAVTAMAKAYKAWKDKKITYSTYTTLKNKIEDVVEGKVKKSKLEGRLQEEVAIQRLADVKKKVKEKLLGEGYNPSQLYSAPGINPKVVSDLIDSAFNLAEKAIKAGFTIKEAVEKASKLIKSSPAYKAAVRNKQIDEKEFESKISEAVNEETEALKKAFEEEQKKQERKPVPVEEELKTGEKKTRKGYERQNDSKKYDEIYSKIPAFEKEYEEISNKNIVKYVNATLDKFEAEPNGLVNLANDLLDNKKQFSVPVNIPMMKALAERLYKLSKDSSSSDLAKNSAARLAGKLIIESEIRATTFGQAVSALNITAKLVSSSEEVSMANIEHVLNTLYEEKISKKEKENVDDAVSDLSDVNNDAEIRKQIKEELMNEYAEKLFGKDKAKEISDAFDSALIDLKDC